MHRATILKLYPTEEQADLLYRQLGVVRWCYNHFLALRIRHYKMFGKKDGFKTCNYVRCSKHLTKIKERKDFLFIPAASALQQKLQDLDKAFIGLWKHKRGLNRSMLDSVWGEIRRQLEYKTATMRAGRFYASSKLCNNCGHKNTALTLSDRKWDCESCRASHDRDVNAALNLVSWATNALRGEKVRPDGMQVPEGIFLGSEKMHR